VGDAPAGRLSDAVAGSDITVKAKRLGDGARLTFAEIEQEALSGLLNDLADALREDGLQPGDPVYDRLYPDGYSGAVDADEQQVFRDLTRAGLRDDRLVRIDACSAEVLAAADTQGRIEVDATGYDRWLRVLNDLRLTLGTRLEIVEDDQPWDLSPADPKAAAYLLYGWLTEVQDRVVRIALR
jgi:hypothetical protein